MAPPPHKKNSCDTFDHMIIHFIWNGTTIPGIHLVSWKKITLSRKLGFLGVRSTRDANTTLLGKMVWDMLQIIDKIWVFIFSNKYFLVSHLLLPSITWSFIAKVKNLLKEGFDWKPVSLSSSLCYSYWTSLGPIVAVVYYIHIHDLNLSFKYFDSMM